MDSILRDRALAPEGDQKIEWVKHHMPLLYSLESEFAAEQPFKGLRMTVSIHLEAKTAYLCRVLRAGGAQVWVTGSNPLSTQDDVAAGLAGSGLTVFALNGATEKEYKQHIALALSHKPHIIIDDGGDLIHALHTDHQDYGEHALGGCEETTTGVMRLKAMEREGVLRFPMISINNARMKYLFDNRYGTGQSVWDGINRTTNLIVAGKTVVVAGYGWCGKGIAMRAKGLGAKVAVTEVDPVKAVEAVMDGFEVMPMDEAAKIGDLFVTVTGCKQVITERHFLLMKDGAVLCNAGHFDVEVYMPDIERVAVAKKEQRRNITGYQMPNGRWLSVLGEGRLVNLAAGDGHPAEIMDMSFALQALSARYLAAHYAELAPGVHAVPEDIDRDVAERKLAALGVRTDTLTEEQAAYLNSWDE
ncbi:MAG: adenosylhomocysteinase [Oscillospiraceae bacterium]|nr:adenosylhomocysteinase [Oscillospiraceae bacterium]